jgi:hypothetical protein
MLFNIIYYYGDDEGVEEGVGEIWLGFGNTEASL